MQDIILYVIILIPFLYMVIFEQEDLHKKKAIIRYLFLGILSCFIGYLYFETSTSDKKWLVYFGSQTTITYLLIFNLVSYPFRRKFKRNPEIAEEDLNKFIEVIAAFIIIMGTIMVPFLIDSYMLKYAIP